VAVTSEASAGAETEEISGRVELNVDVECKVATWGGVELGLTRYEFRLLAVLVSRRGRVWSRDELMSRVWEDPGASLDRTVDAHIKTLRAKLRAVAGDAGELIQTHRGEGYSLRTGERASRSS
jgi:two-component system catabolic regulation response regulator CreB